jgi:hypothetical protein
MASMTNDYRILAGQFPEDSLYRSYFIEAANELDNGKARLFEAGQKLIRAEAEIARLRALFRETIRMIFNEGISHFLSEEAATEAKPYLDECRNE